MIFLGHPVWGNALGNRYVYVFGTEAPKRRHVIKEKFFGRATILMEVIYLSFQPISWNFLIFRTLCMPKIHFE